MLRKYVEQVRLKEAVPPASYLGHLPVVQYLMAGHSVDFDRDVTIFVGENGTGKSTLLEAVAIAYGFNAEGGSRNFHFATQESHSALWQYLTLSKGRHAEDGFFLRAESFYNVASYVDAIDDLGRVPLTRSYGGKSLHEQSHGESFLSLVQNRFRGKGLYILDEPEAALSPLRQMTLLVELSRLVKRGSQFIIATHSPILLAFPKARVYQFSTEGLAAVDYQDTDHYQLMKRFLNQPEQMLAWLLEEEEKC